MINPNTPQQVADDYEARLAAQRALIAALDERIATLEAALRETKNYLAVVTDKFDKNARPVLKEVIGKADAALADGPAEITFKNGAKVVFKLKGNP